MMKIKENYSLTNEELLETIFSIAGIGVSRIDAFPKAQHIEYDVHNDWNDLMEIKILRTGKIYLVQDNKEYYLGNLFDTPHALMSKKLVHYQKQKPPGHYVMVGEEIIKGILRNILNEQYVFAYTCVSPSCSKELDYIIKGLFWELETNKNKKEIDNLINRFIDIKVNKKMLKGGLK